MNKELWRIIPKHVDFEVSNLGKVRRASTKIHRELFLTGNGYPIVNIDGKSELIHVLVAETFIGERPKGYVVDHKDTNRFNNKPENLRWLTNSANIKRSPYVGGQPGFYCGELWLMRKLANAGINQNIIAKIFKCSRGYVSLVKIGRRTRCKESI